MHSNSRIVVSVLASLMLSACSSSDPASDDYCQDPEHNHLVPVKHHESLVYSGPSNEVGYQNIYSRYEKLEKVYYVPSFILVEDSLLVGHLHHKNNVYHSDNSFEEWLMVQTGHHHSVCTDEYPACMTGEELAKFYQSTGSHSDDHDRVAFLESVNSSDRVQFAFDSSQLDEKAVFEAAEIAQYLKRYPNKKLVVLGSADSIGDARYNKALSRKRAEALRDELVSLGIPEGQIELSWKGEYQSGEGPKFRVAELSYE